MSLIVPANVASLVWLIVKVEFGYNQAKAPASPDNVPTSNDKPLCNNNNLEVPVNDKAVLGIPPLILMIKSLFLTILLMLDYRFDHCFNFHLEFIQII